MADEIDVQQTDAEMVSALGWDPLPEDTPQPVEATPTPSPAPAPTESPVPVVPASPAVPDQLEQARVQVRQQEARLAITQAALQFREQLIQEGTDQETAQAQAEQVAQTYWANFQRDSALDIANELKKTNLVQQLAQEHGVAPEMLQGFNDPDSMRAAAKIYGAQGKELAGLKAQIGKAKTPTQSYDGGSGTPANNRAAVRAAYNSGGPSLSAAEYQAKFGYDPR